MNSRGRNLPPPRTQRQMWVAFQAVQKQINALQRFQGRTPNGGQPAVPDDYVGIPVGYVDLGGSTYISPTVQRGRVGFHRRGLGPTSQT